VQRKTFTLSEVICHWCREIIVDSPYRSPIPDIPGGRYVVCSPTCAERPEGVLVFTDWRSQ
jgi:hypothetical protein